MVKAPEMFKSHILCTYISLAFAKQRKTGSEFGRTMTEMLSVLAIVGILFVTGVKMYSSAMNKHRANELINEANKRAVVVAMQITAGQDTLSVGDFKDPEGYIFGVEKNPANNKQFNITINNVPADVCTQMKVMVGLGTVVQLISDDCTVLTFNDNLSKTSVEQCLAANKVWCTQMGSCSDITDCCFAGDCTATSCPRGATTTGTGGSTGIFVRGTECKCATGYVYTGTECVIKPTTCSSWTTNECGKGYYCKFTYNADDNLNPDLNGTVNETEQACYQGIENRGTCTAITAVAQPTTAERTLLRQAGFKSTFLKGQAMNWWSANSWCLAQGRHLIDVSSMNCYRFDDNTLMQAAQTGGYCCKKGQSCQQSSWKTTLWDGKSILQGKEEDVAKFGDKMVALMKVYGATYFWTSSPYGNTSSNSCYAFCIVSNDGSLSRNSRIYNSFALCE